jgi:hypothetical protein
LERDCAESQSRLFIGSGCATRKLVAATAARGPEVFDGEIIPQSLR